MSLVHDMAESIVGDIPPEAFTNVDREEKLRREKVKTITYISV